MGFFESIASTFSRSFDYEGRSSRSEYWYWVICMTILLYPLGYFLGYNLGDFGVLVAGLVSILFAFPSIALIARRLHDRNLSGWWQLGYVIPFGAIPLLVIVGFLPGTPGSNRFGQNPLTSNKDSSSETNSNKTNSTSHSGSFPPAHPKQEVKKSSSWFEEFRLLEEYDSLVSQCHKEIIELNEELAEIFRKEVVANRKSARDIADRLISEHQRLTNPFESEELNAAFNEARKLGKKAEEEFKKVVNLLGEEDTDIKFTLAKIHEKYSPKEKPAGYAAPSVSFGQIKADLQEIDIRVFMPLWAGGYKIIDQEGVKHWVSTDAELKAYYLKQSIKDKNKKIDLADSASNESSKNLSTNERTAFLDEEESTRASKANGLVKTPPSPDASKEEGMLLSHYLHSKGWKTEWFDPTGRIASIGTSVSGSFSGDNNCNFYEPFNCGFPPPKQLWHRKLFYDGITQIKVIEKERQGSSIFIDTLEVKVSGHEFKYGEWYTYRLADLSDRFCLEHLEHPGERFSFFVAGLTYVDSLYIK